MTSPPLLNGLEPELAAALVRSSSDGILAFDRELRYTYWNPGMERISGVPAAEVIGRVAFEAFPFLIDMGEDHAFREALAGRHTVTRDRPFRVPESGRRGFFEGSYSPLLDARGEVVGGVGIIRDVTGRRAVEESGRRFAFLAEVGRELSSSLDAGRMLERLAELLVERMADYVIVDVFGEGGEIRRAAVAHRRLDGREVLLEVQRRFPPTLAGRSGAALVLRTGEALLWEEVSAEQLREALRDEEHLRLMDRLGVRSVIVVPFLTRGRVLGSMSLVIGDDDRRFGRDDLALAEEIGHRAALALDNAQRVEELATADRRKDEFLAMLAHELRNPLAAIANAGTVLSRRNDSADPRSGELVAMIGRQIRHLSRLVDDLLDVSRFSRGRIELRKERFELRRAVEGAVEAARPLIEQRRHELTVALSDEPLWLEADVTRIEQVFANLLHNAAKFTEPGGRVALTAAREGDQAVVRVRDTGAGISPELLPRIFDLFVQEERSLARSQGGLGIGLTLVRALVERHGGAVSVTSGGPGRGSELTVRLPLAAVPEREARETAPAPGAERTSRVLLVEDNLDAAEALAELLRMWGHEVEMAHDGTSALAAARQARPEVVLLDIGLPGMDGYEVARRLRSLPTLAATRIVALTGYGQEADRRRSHQAGFDDHLVKPVDLHHLRGLLADSGDSGRDLA